MKWLYEESSVSVVPGEVFGFDADLMMARIATHHETEFIIGAFDAIIQSLETTKTTGNSADPNPVTKPDGALSLLAPRAATRE